MPTADPNNLFGRLVTRRDVELAAVAFLQAWVPTYVAEIERQAGLPARTIPLPPDQNFSYRGGLDFSTWEPSWSPVYIVNAQPEGLPTRVAGEGAYIQQFDLHCCVNFQLTGSQDSLGEIEEDSARQYADMLGMAAAAAILQHGGMGTWPDGSPVSFRTWMTQYPRTVFPFEDERSTCRSEFNIQVMVSDVVTEADGPRAPFANPYTPGQDYAEVTTITITEQTLTTDGVNTDPQVGAAITTEVGEFPNEDLIPGETDPGDETGTVTVRY